MAEKIYKTATEGRKALQAYVDKRVGKNMTRWQNAFWTYIAYEIGAKTLNLKFYDAEKVFEEYDQQLEISCSSRYGSGSSLPEAPKSGGRRLMEHQSHQDYDFG